MKNAIIASLILHSAIVILVWLDLKNPFPSKPAESPPLIIDFQAVGSQSMAKHLSPFNEKKQDVVKKPNMPKPTETTPELDVVQKIETPASEAPTSENNKPEKPQEKPLKSEPVKEIPKDNIVIDETKKDNKKREEVNLNPKDKESPKNNNKSKPIDKKDDKKTSKKTDKSTLVNLNKAKKIDKNKIVDKKTKNAEKALDDFMDKMDDVDGNQEASAPADSVGDVLTATEIQAVIATISKCWHVPVGTQGVLDTSVDVTLHMNEDGTVRDAEIEDVQRFKNDPVFRTAAESVRHAALDPKCNPLPLPKKTYSSWKTLPFNFNPKTMAGISGGVR